MDISRVKINLGRKVLYNGIEYVLSACIIRLNEQGKFEPDINTIIAVSDLFNITTDELLK